jgi:DNA repair exonuclease SbcCD ATPase subunit
MSRARKANWKKEFKSLRNQINELVSEENVRDEDDQKDLEKKAASLNEYAASLGAKIRRYNDTSSGQDYNNIEDGLKIFQEKVTVFKALDKEYRDFFAECKLTEIYLKDEAEAVIEKEMTSPKSPSGLSNFFSIFCCAGKKDYEVIEEPRQNPGLGAGMSK